MCIYYYLFFKFLIKYMQITAAIKGCSQKTSFLLFKTVIKNHLKSRKYPWEIPWKEFIIKLRFKFLASNFTKTANSFTWLFQEFGINFKNTFPRLALNGCFRQLEFSKFSNFFRCLRNLQITELYEMFHYKCNFQLN